MANKSITSDVLTLGDAANPVRVSFLRCWTPKPFQNGGDPRFECAFILDPSNAVHAANIKQFKAVGADIALRVYGDPLPEDLIVPWYKGDKKNYDGYKGMIILPSHQKDRPVIVNRSRVPVREGEKEAPFSGCYCIGKVSLWAIKNQYTPRVSVNFKGLQFVKDGPAFGGAAPIDAEEEFEALEPASSGGGSNVVQLRPGAKNPFEDD